MAFIKFITLPSIIGGRGQIRAKAKQLLQHALRDKHNAAAVPGNRSRSNWHWNLLRMFIHLQCKAEVPVDALYGGVEA